MQSRNRRRPDRGVPLPAPLRFLDYAAYGRSARNDTRCRKLRFGPLVGGITSDPRFVSAFGRGLRVTESAGELRPALLHCVGSPKRRRGLIGKRVARAADGGQHRLDVRTSGDVPRCRTSPFGVLGVLFRGKSWSGEYMALATGVCGRSAPS